MQKKGADTTADTNNKLSVVAFSHSLDILSTCCNVTTITGYAREEGWRNCACIITPLTCQSKIASKMDTVVAANMSKVIFKTTLPLGVVYSFFLDLWLFTQFSDLMTKLSNHSLFHTATTANHTEHHFPLRFQDTTSYYMTRV